MEVSELLDMCRDGMPKIRFASRIGITNTMLHNLYSGRQRLGEKTVAGLVVNYPQYKDRILEVFLPSKSNNSETVAQQ